MAELPVYLVVAVHCLILLVLWVWLRRTAMPGESLREWPEPISRAAPISSSLVSFGSTERATVQRDATVLFAARFLLRSSIRFETGPDLRLEPCPLIDGSVAIRFRNNHSEPATGLPSGFIAEVSGHAASAGKAIELFAYPLTLISPWLSLAANAAVDDLRMLGVQPINDGEHSVAEYSNPPHMNRSEQTRIVAAAAMESFLLLVTSLSTNSPLHRASLHFCRALCARQPGGYLSALAEIYGGLVVLTDPTIKRLCSQHRCQRTELAVALQADEGDLEIVVLRDFLFKGDQEVFRSAGVAHRLYSLDGMSPLHSSLQFDSDIWVRAASLLRSALFDLLDLEGNLRHRLQSAPLSIPLGPP